jgi:hypothetical protein
MSFFETIQAMVPAACVAAGMGLVRRGRTSLGAALALVGASIAVIAAMFGNARPIVGLLALALIMTSFVADENQKRALALACFSAGLIAVIITAFYT